MDKMPKLNPDRPDDETPIGESPVEQGVAKSHRMPSASALGQGLLDGTRRFPVPFALCFVTTIISILQVVGLFGSMPYYDSIDALFGVFSEVVGPDTMPAAFRFACNVVAALRFAIVPTVFAQLAAEWRSAEARQALPAQAITALVAALGYNAAYRAALATEHLGLLVIGAGGVTLACFFLGCWTLFSSDNEDELAPKLARALLYTIFLTIALTVGLLIVTLAAEALVGFSWDDIYEIIFLVTIGLVAPCVFCAQLPRRTDRLESPRAYTVFVGLVVFPLCLLLLSVLYLYIVQIVLAWEMPAGEMNWYGSFALLVYIGLWLGMRMVDHRPARWFVRWGWLLLTPVVITQLVGIRIRLAAYGLTPLRYASLLCLAVGIAALVLSALNARPGTVLLCAAAAALIGGVSPANVFDVPNTTQEARLRSALVEAGMLDDEGLIQKAPITPSDELAERILGSWEYLEYAERGYVPLPLTDEISAHAKDASYVELFGFGWPESSEENDYAWWRAYLEPQDDKIDVSGFSQVYSLDTISSGSRYSLAAKDGYRITCAWSDGTRLDVSLEGLIGTLEKDYHDQIVASNDSYGEIRVPNEVLRIPCDDGRVLMVTNLTLSVNRTDGIQIEDLDAEGMLLVP